MNSVFMMVDAAAVPSTEAPAPEVLQIEEIQPQLQEVVQQPRTEEAVQQPEIEEIPIKVEEVQQSKVEEVAIPREEQTTEPLAFLSDIVEGTKIKKGKNLQ